MGSGLLGAHSGSGSGYGYRRTHHRKQLFRMLWSCTDVRHDNSGKTDLIHPLVGPLTLDFQHMVLGSGHVLVVYWADPGSASERTLRQLSDA